ncbi:MAG TPA: sigma-70 family RNA polymerase sigma factor [Egibacteraceae bacterium]|nr:sigma-70 family RNA polymerase sigma factor [Egibacteraceae bacterium]
MADLDPGTTLRAQLPEPRRCPAAGRTPSATAPAATSESFAALFATFHAEALRLAYLRCGDAHGAEDAVSEAFARVWRRWRSGGVSQPRAYLRRAVVNEVNSRFRRLARQRREAARRCGDQRGPRSADDQLADGDALFQALRALPRRQRSAVVLRFYADLSERDAAEVMGVSVGTVKSSVSRGLQRLRAMLAVEMVPGGQQASRDGRAPRHARGRNGAT